MADPSLKASSLIKYYLQRPNANGDNPALVAQFEHRSELISFWGITPGSRVLELGCGQGDCTVVLADAVGETGHVDALDPGAPDYGSPFTLSQSQSYIKTTPLGLRITFHNTDTASYLASLAPSHEPYDFIVLAHCIWYFESPTILPSLIASLAPHTQKLCIAEWALRSSAPAGVPHVLTALLLGNLEAKRAVPARGNIRTVLSLRQIQDAVREAGRGAFVLEREMRGEGRRGMLDGYWEVSDTLRERVTVLRALEEEERVGEKELKVFGAMYDGIDEAVSLLEEGVRGVRCMDFWAGVFEARSF